MADDPSAPRRSSASSRADTPLLQASTALADITSHDLTVLGGSPELVVGGPPSAPSPLELRAFASQPPKSRFARPIDFRQLELVHPANDNLLCRICISPFVRPKRLLCEHAFCDDCLNQYLSFAVQPYAVVASARCPTCRRELDMDSEPTGVSRIITNMLDEMVVRCPNHRLGCLWQGQRAEAQDHVDFSCNCRMVECPVGYCAHGVMAKDADKGCLHKYVNCEHCDERLMELDLENHQLRFCSSRMDACRFCDGQVIRRLMSAHHEEECPKSVVGCSAKHFGCDHQCQRDRMAEHTRNCIIVKMLPVLEGMKARQDGLVTENDQLRRQVAHLESGLNALQAMVALPAGTTAYDAGADLANPAIDANNQNMISQHEALRNEVSRLSVAIAEVEARMSMQLHSELLRINTDMARTEANLGAIRSQQQWLISARMQAIAQMRANAAAAANTTAGASASGASTASTASAAATGISRATAATSSAAVAIVGRSSRAGSSSRPVRRLSDSTRQETKL